MVVTDILKENFCKIEIFTIMNPSYRKRKEKEFMENIAELLVEKRREKGQLITTRLYPRPREKNQNIVSIIIHGLKDFYNRNTLVMRRFGL